MFFDIFGQPAKGVGGSVPARGRSDTSYSVAG